MAGESERTGDSLHHYNFKIVLLGDAYVGKTSFLFQFLEGIFRSDYLTTIGIDFNIKVLNVQGHVVKLQIWDTAGQERGIALMTSYVRGANGCIVVFDVTNRNSFLNVEKWIKIYKEANPTISTHNFILAGNKVDEANRTVQPDEGETLAAAIQAKYFETSAKTGLDVQIAFNALAETLLTQRLLEGSMKMNRSSFKLEKGGAKNRTASRNRCLCRR